MEAHVLIGIGALVLVAVAVSLTAIWQREARRDRRIAHVEAELGISDAERENVELGKGERKPADKTVRARLESVERRDVTLAKRVDRLSRR